MSPEVTLSTPEPGVAVLRLNRPHRGNAFTRSLIHLLHRTLDEIAKDKNCRVVVLIGAGQNFCVGGDFELVEAVAPSRMSLEDLTEHIRLTADLSARLQSLPQPVISAVNGAAAGGGMALALATDVRVCSHSAKFCTAFTAIGLAAAEMGLSFNLPRIVGPTAAFELMLTSRTITAQEAFRIGLTLEPLPTMS